jgi:hypothetical protein
MRLGISKIQNLAPLPSLLLCALAWLSMTTTALELKGDKWCGNLMCVAAIVNGSTTTCGWNMQLIDIC